MGEQRELAAIVPTDMVGYAGLSQRAERVALQVLDMAERRPEPPSAGSASASP